MAGKKDEGRLKCSFCGKTQDQVRKADCRTGGLHL